MLSSTLHLTELNPGLSPCLEIITSGLIVTTDRRLSLSVTGTVVNAAVVNAFVSTYF